MKKYTKPILITLASMIIITVLATVFIPQFSHSVKMPADEQFLSKIHCDGGNAEEGVFCFCVVTDTTGLQGVINKAGQWVIEPKYESVATYPDYAIAVMDGIRLQIGYDGMVISDAVIEDMEELTYSKFDEDEDYNYELPSGLFSYTMGGRKGLLSPDGKQLTPPIYQNITAINASMYRMFLDDGESSILLHLDEQGELIPVKFNFTNHGNDN